MATDSWVIPLTAVAATGNLQQLYPAFVSAGIAKGTATAGQLVRQPMNGVMHSLQIKPNGADGGTIEFYDIDGQDWGADVSSADVITNAQLTTALASTSSRKAKLIFTQEFAGTIGSGVANAPGIYRAFMRGLAARFWNAGPTGTCTLNLVCNGGYYKYPSRGN